MAETNNTDREVILRRIRPAVRIVFFSMGVLGVVVAVGVALDRFTLEHIARMGSEQRIVFQLDAPYGSVDLAPGAPPTDIATIQTLSEDGGAHSSQWSYGIHPGGVGMLRIGVGTDEGMRAMPPIAMWQAHSGFSRASAIAPEPDWGTARPTPFLSFSMPAIPGFIYTRTISTDAGTKIMPASRSGTKIFLANSIPIDLLANLGLGESSLDLSGLSLTSANIETGASRANISSREVNPVSMRNCLVSAGMGICTFTGISNLNSDFFTFHGAVGSYHLGFDGKLRHNIDATVELGIGSCTISIPPTVARVQIFYDDGFLSSFSFSGLNVHRDGYATSPGFKYSTSPIITMHLSSGAGKISVSYH